MTNLKIGLVIIGILVAFATSLAQASLFEYHKSLQLDPFEEILHSYETTTIIQPAAEESLKKLWLKLEQTKKRIQQMKTKFHVQTSKYYK